MSRAVKEWIANHDDQAIPPRVKLRVFERTNGHCAKCTRQLVPGKWDCDHVVALVNGGQHRETNLEALCASPCHSDKTKADTAIKSENYRVRSKSVGVKRRKRTIPGRRFNGDPIPARWK